MEIGTNLSYCGRAYGVTEQVLELIGDKMEKIDMDKFSYMEVAFNGKELVRLDAYGNVFVEGKKVAYSEALGEMVELNIVEEEKALDRALDRVVKTTKDNN